ncbi:GyrI-like domain-containing protein [Paenibacillus sp. MBLB4367]|uniref:GyrI-like domain-containing protein n=1 Tax=Paenibacillus sp. MBLB4367 TaxID=3384767 RepID=UPI003907F82B
MEPIKPIFMKKDAFLLVGVDKYTDTGFAAIEEAWMDFQARAQDIRNRVNEHACYGFEDYTRGFAWPQGAPLPHYHYIAAAQVSSLEDIPEGLFGRSVPAATYAVFTRRMPLSELHKAFRYVYDEWLPQSGYEIDPAVGADFEYYPEPVADHEHALIEIYLPIVPKA